MKALVDRKTLQAMASLFSKATDELNLDITGEGISAKISGLSGFCGAIVSLPRKEIKELDGSAILGIDTKKFLEILSLFKEDEVELSLEDEVTLGFQTESQNASLRLIDVTEGPTLPTPEKMKSQLETRFVVDGPALKQTVKDLDKFSDFGIIVFNAGEKTFALSITKPILSVNKNIPVIECSGGQGKGKFRLEFLKELLEGVDGDLELWISNDKPVFFSFKLGLADCKTFIAPRIEGD